MRDTKKIFTRMCLNNWGGIRHTVLKFHEYVNLFSGKSGSGKSTVMDAMQVILYGSFSSTFLNKRMVQPTVVTEISVLYLHWRSRIRQQRPAVVWALLLKCEEPMRIYERLLFSAMSESCRRTVM